MVTGKRDEANLLRPLAIVNPGFVLHVVGKEFVFLSRGDAPDFVAAKRYPPVNLTVCMRIPSRASNESKASVSITADVRSLSHSRMYAPNLAEVSGTGNPNATEIGPEDFHYAVGDLLEFQL